MYEPLLFIHSWTRWIVVLGGVYFLIRSLVGWIGKAPWTAADNHFIWAYNQIVGYQILFGLTLYLGASPFLKMVVAHPHLAVSNGIVSFWMLRHGPTMIFAYGLFHIGRARAKRASIDSRHRIYALTFLTVLAVIGSAIPWPWLLYGRPWFRWFF